MGPVEEMPQTKQGKTVSLVTFGCAKNLVDSEVMLGCLGRAGYTFSTDPEKADVVVLNTCGFIKPAREEAVQAFEKAVALKRKKKKKLVVATGCFVERYKDALRSKYPEIDVWLGVRDFDKIVPAIEGRPFRGGKTTFLCSHNTPRLLSTPPSWAYLKISEGCSHECAFCAIPLIKGPYRSRRVSSILEEAQELGRRGVKEINLVSQDTTYFGRDKGTKDGLIRLLRRLVDVRGIRWIRLLYGYPEEITDGLLDVMAEDKICSYLDIPFQHADRGILKGMKRSLDGTRALALIEKIRKRLPDIALRTSLIVGFPGEGRREFESLKAFVRAARFDHLGVFSYSPEEGTDSFRAGDPILEEDKIKRQEEIMQIQAEISLAINRKYLNSLVEVVVETRSAGGSQTPFGRARFQAPEVDGVIYFRDSSTPPRRLRPLEKVEIVAADVYDLHGKIVR
jgi:ribosomal protein S12 methylthiotransferase